MTWSIVARSKSGAFGVAIDVGAFSNEALQVRICYTRAGGLSFAGWSVDDVTIGALSLVTRDIPSGTRAWGVPARPVG